MSRLYRTVKRYYDLGYYDNDDVKVFVRRSRITVEEYKLITGEDYGE